MKKPRWSVTKEEQLVKAIIEVNQLCNELQIPELLPMDACKTILDASAAYVEQTRKFILRVNAEEVAKARPRTKRIQ